MILLRWRHQVKREQLIRSDHYHWECLLPVTPVNFTAKSTGFLAGDDEHEWWNFIKSVGDFTQ